MLVVADSAHQKRRNDGEQHDQAEDQTPAESVGKDAQRDATQGTKQNGNGDRDTLLHWGERPVLADDRHHRRHGSKYGETQRKSAGSEG